MAEDNSYRPDDSDGEFEDSFEFQTPERAESKVTAHLMHAVLEKGWLTSEELQDCLNERYRRDPRPPLAAILLEREHLNDEQLGELLHYLGAGGRSGGEREGLTLGEGAVRRGLTTNSEIFAALEEQEKQRRGGLDPRLGEILVKRGTLTVSQVKSILAQQDRRILRCGGCGSQYNVDSYSPEKKYSCLKCGDELTDSGPVDTLNVEGTASDVDSAIQSLDSLFVGRRVGPCEITEKIGEGGMGAVYKARHIALNKTVAIKIMSPAVMGETHKKRFLREARSAASLEHPNVVVVHDTGEEYGFPYIVMQYIEGKSLGEILHTKRKVSPGHSLRIMISAASALGAAHEQHLIHRDIKPDNIMITTKGEVKVTDFGLAKSIHKEDMTITSAGTLMGTPVYMSPEQFEGEKVDARSDIYSLGVTFYRMLAGHAPFEGDTVLDLWKAHASAPPPPLDDDVPPGVQAIVYRMIAKNPGERYQTAGEMLADMRSVYQEVSADGDEDDSFLFADARLPVEIAGRKVRPLVLIIAAAVILLVVILAFIFAGGGSGVVHPTAGEMNLFNQARERSGGLALDRKYIEALGAWDEFGRKNPQEYWTGLVHKEKKHILQMAESSLKGMLKEAGELTDAGNLELARDKCREVQEKADAIDREYPETGLREVSQKASQELGALDALIARRAQEGPAADDEKAAEWKEAKDLIERQVKAGKFASARFTCLRFTSTDFPVEIRGEAEQKLAGIDAAEQLHKSMLAEQEKIRFENDMLDARLHAEVEDFEKAKEILAPYLEHDNREFRKTAQQVLSEVRNFEDFVLAMREADRLREQKKFDRALQVVGRYTGSAKREWADIAREKRLQLKKERFLDKGLVYVEGGKFKMGSKDPADGNPEKDVTLRPFYIGKFEVTNSEYYKFIKSTGRGGPDNWPDGKPQDGLLDCPVTMITVKDAGAYCAWLTKKEGVKHRLPTEAEWEMAASWDGRAKRAYPWGNDFRKDTCNIDGKLLPAGQCRGDVSPAEACDMAGNACELVEAAGGGGYAIRGGCCDDGGNRRSARTTYRQKCDKNTTGSSIGFRVVREDK